MKQWRPLNELLAPESAQGAKGSAEVKSEQSKSLTIHAVELSEQRRGSGSRFVSTCRFGVVFLGLVAVLTGVVWLLLAAADSRFDLSSEADAPEMREFEVIGRVTLQNWSGALTVPTGGWVAVIPAATMERELRGRLASVDRARADAETELGPARVRWREKAAARDEAQRVFIVAERANTPDVEMCRQRLIAAEAALSDAFIDLEEVSARIERLMDAGAVVEELAEMSDAVPLDSTGRFTLRVCAEMRPLVFVKAEPSLVWLEPVEVGEGKSVILELSNANVLDLATLRARGGLTD